jgi:hypothetical protein
MEEGAWVLLIGSAIALGSLAVIALAIFISVRKRI